MYDYCATNMIHNMVKFKCNTKKCHHKISHFDHKINRGKKSLLGLITVNTVTDEAEVIFCGDWHLGSISQTLWIIVWFLVFPAAEEPWCSPDKPAANGNRIPPAFLKTEPSCCCGNRKKERERSERRALLRETRKNRDTNEIKWMCDREKLPSQHNTEHFKLTVFTSAVCKHCFPILTKTPTQNNELHVLFLHIYIWF